MTTETEKDLRVFCTACVANNESFPEFPRGETELCDFHLCNDHAAALPEGFAVIISRTRAKDISADEYLVLVEEMHVSKSGKVNGDLESEQTGISKIAAPIVPVRSIKALSSGGTVGDMDSTLRELTQRWDGPFVENREARDTSSHVEQVVPPIPTARPSVEAKVTHTPAPALPVAKPVPVAALPTPVPAPKINNVVVASGVQKPLVTTDHPAAKAPRASSDSRIADEVERLVEQLEPDIDERTHRFMDIMARANVAFNKGVQVIVDVSQLFPMEDQLREYFDLEDLYSLADSLMGVQLHPIIIRKKKGPFGTTKQIIDDERRWISMQLAMKYTIRAILVEIDDEAAPFIVSAVANFNRPEHTPLEVSSTIVRMHDGEYKLPMARIASSIGLSLHTTYQMYGLRNLHPQVRQLMSPHLSPEKRLALTAAKQICKIPAVLQYELALDVIVGKVKLGGLRNHILDLSEKRGFKVRERVIDPAEDWRVSMGKAEVVLKNADELRERLARINLDMVLLGKKGQAAVIEGVLRRTEETIAACRKMIEEARTRR